MKKYQSHLFCFTNELMEISKIDFPGLFYESIDISMQQIQLNQYSHHSQSSDPSQHLMNLFIDALDALDQPYRYCHMFQIIDRKALVFFQMKFEFDRICYFDEQKSVRKLNALTKKGQQLSVAYRNLENLPQLYQASIVKNKELKEQIAAELSIIKKLHLDAKSTVIDAFASEFVIDKNLF